MKCDSKFLGKTSRGSMNHAGQDTTGKSHKHKVDEVRYERRHVDDTGATFGYKKHSRKDDTDKNDPFERERARIKKDWK